MKPPFRFKRTSGFALVVTVSMMVLLTIIVVATLSLSTVTLRSVDREAGQAVARANARMALMVAIGQLQMQAGPDRRVTGTAELYAKSDEVANPQWTAVWKTGPDDEKSSWQNTEPTWLVSGGNSQSNDLKPSMALDSKNSALLVSIPKNSSTAKPREVRAKYVEIKGNKLDGRYAWWVGDEGVKVRVDTSRPEEKASTLSAREGMSRSQSPVEPGFALMDNENKSLWKDFDPDSSDVDKSNLPSMGTVSFAVNASDGGGGLSRSEIPAYYFNDLTTGGYGLPVNVTEGGLKMDLSLLFDSSQKGSPALLHYLGSNPTQQTLLDSTIYNFAAPANAENRLKFSLSDLITSENPGGFVGPNWGILYNYARMWENVSGNSASMIGLNPRVGTDLRQQKWLPYKEAGKGGGNANAMDVQHTNSGLSPVLSMVQMGFLLSARDLGKVGNPPEQQYEPQLLIKPIIGMWNPYNVTIKPSSYKFEWAVNPYFRFDYQKPSANGSFPNGSGNVTEIWMRDYWSAKSSGEIPSEGNQGGSYIRLFTPKVDFQPGEFRLFSVKANPSLQEDNQLVPTLDPKGAYRLTFKKSIANGKHGDALKIKEGFYGWFGDVYMQDTHYDGTGGTATTGHFQARYGKQLDLDAAATWMTLKGTNGTTDSSKDTHLSRFTNLWNGGRDYTMGSAAASSTALPYIPEPIVSARNRLQVGGASGKVPYPIEQLAENTKAGSGDVGRIGTWRFYIRNPTELQDQKQGLRGWIDSNPRSMANNTRFDGSKVESNKVRQGWNTTSHFIAGAHKTGAKHGDVGDGKGGDRGLVAEGNYTSNMLPQGVPSEDRWQAYGGPGTTANTGFTNVVIYDVPQAPLVSIGQFQHAQLSRYNYEPGFVVGNSYANLRIPLDKISRTGFGADGAAPGFNIVDISYEVNKKIWDKAFFSTLGSDYVGGGGSLDQAFDFKALASGSKQLPNPRMMFSPLRGDTSLQGIVDADKTKAPQAMAARVLVHGAFNVNSTSKIAWKALLSSMGSSELPVIDFATGTTSWQDPKGIRFNRFGHPILNASFKGGGTLKDPAFWQGWRELSESELDTLAGLIVEEVKARGPFRSMGEFVNRKPEGPIEQQRKGALQSAIDKVANTNAALTTKIGRTAMSPEGSNFDPNVINQENQAAGHAGYLLQGDILQSLAPVMQVRSDYFRIRTCGEALGKDGSVIARVWCEAFVQRMPEYVDTSSDKPEVDFDNLKGQTNITFGRRFQLVSFRWLSSSEI